MGDNDVNAFYLADNGDIYVSFNKSQNMHGKANYHGPEQIKDTNIYRFVPDSLGENTAGHFELYFDGSDVGLSSDGEDIDALYIEPSGSLIISTLDLKVPGSGGTTLRGKDEDLLVFTPTSLGENTAGTWSLFLNGSAQGLNEPSEDISGVWLNSQSQIFLTAKGNFSVAGAQGDGADIFVCTLGGSGCTFSLALDGSTIGLAGERIHGRRSARCQIMSQRLSSTIRINRQSRTMKPMTMCLIVTMMRKIPIRSIFPSCKSNACRLMAVPSTAMRQV